MSDPSRFALQDLHSVILMIAQDFDAFCKAHDIQYFMMGGTALGAMRHGGFIPWDDDFDVFMDRENYKKFLHLAPQGMSEQKYYLQHEMTEEWPLYFSKLRLQGTRYEEADNAGRHMHEGVFIDVMCLNSAYENRALRWLQYFAGKLLSAAALARRGYKTRSSMKRFVMRLAKAAVRGPVEKMLLKMVRGRETTTSRFVGHFFGRAPFDATSFPRSYLGMARYVPFETTQLPVPQNVEAYLATRFGPNYMDPPSAAVRAQFPSHVINCDLGEWIQR